MGHGRLARDYLGRHIMHSVLLSAVLLMLSGLLPTSAAVASGIPFPGKEPGTAKAEQSDNSFTLSNDVLSAHWRVDGGKLRLTEFTNALASAPETATEGEPFVITLTTGDTLNASDCATTSAPQVERITGRSNARRLADRSGGARVSVALASPDQSLDVTWKAELRDGSNYVIQRVTLVPVNGDFPVETVRLIDVVAPAAKVTGVTQGAPVVAGTCFFALEHPMSESVVEGSRVRCSLHRGEPLAKGKPLALSSVMGVTPPNQLRRGFLYYLERERAHPYRPFLHYNSWYDISWGDRKFNEAQSIAAIETFGRELVEKRGVTMDSFVFDDGWDDNATLWQFHDGFPNGFTPLRKAAERYGSALGVWLSPFGGYGEAREQRLKYGREQGFEVNRNGFSLAGERYYKRFHDICAAMVQTYGVNFFKFDGMGPGNNKVGGEEFLDDIEALMRLTDQLRELEPDLFVSATTGTWCTPYFLWHADSTWRSASDMDFCGKGSKRQQWINYRDTYTYQNVVQQGPLYPLNSLMTQGIVHSQHGPSALMGGNPKDFADEVWSFFGSGTDLQELYIAPQLLTAQMWDILAAGAKWSRENADVLVDTHWIGGDPGQNEIYGWASWSPRKAILVLRNPDDKLATITIDIGHAFELPDGATRDYRLQSPGPSAQQTEVIEVAAGQPHTISLDAFQTVVYDAELTR